MHLADIPDATRTIEFLFADAVGCLSRDRELLADARTAPEGSALRRHLGDARSSFRQSQKLVAELLGKLAELEKAVSRFLPDVAPELRVVGTGKEADDVDAVIRELRLIRSAAIRAAAPPDPDQDLDDEPVTPGKIADRLGIPDSDRKTRTALVKRLERWRNSNRGGGWVEVADPKPREPRYLYPLRTIWTIVEDLKVSR